jgi:hypothetical protein
VRGAFHLDDGLAGADGVVAVLEVEAEEDIGRMLEEDIADGAVHNVLDRRGLYKRPSGQCRSGVNMDKYKPGGRYSPPQERGDCCNGRSPRGRP